MNGQTARLEATRQIVHRCRVRQLVETGTYRGTTTEWLAQFGLPVSTIESNEQSYNFSKLRLARYPNVGVNLGSSVEHLQLLTQQLDLTLPTFFYLDAHWEDHLPLVEEVNIIVDHFSSPVILIDDFQVPDDPEYTYDDYGPGKALTRELLAACWREPMQMFYPATPAHEETGVRRGWIVLTTDARMAAILGTFDLLRRTCNSTTALA